MARSQDTISSDERVDVLVRTVPSGVSSDGADLKFTLALRPVQRPRGATALADGVRLARWPSDAQQLALGRTLELRLAVPGATPSPVDAAWLPPVTPTPWVTLDEVEAATQLWSAIVPPTPGDFSTFLTALPTLDGGGGPVDATCISTQEGNIALLLQLLRAVKAMEVAGSEPATAAGRFEREALAAAAAALGDSRLKELYDKLEGNGAGPPAPPLAADGGDRKLHNDEVTALKRKAAIDICLDAAKAACAEAKAAGAALCRGDPSPLVFAQQADGGRCVGGTHLQATAQELFRKLIDLRMEFLLGAAHGDEELAALKKSVDEKAAYAAPGGEDSPDAKAEEQARRFVIRRLFGLDESPDLGRLFRTFVDLAVPAADIADRLGIRLADDETRTVHVFVRASDEGLAAPVSCSEHSRWTLAKLTLTRVVGVVRATHFLPATRHELLPSNVVATEPQQRDGLALLGRLTTAGTPTHALLSTDLRMAGRVCDQLADGLLTRAAADTAATAAPAPIVLSEPAVLRAAGLALVNFGCATELSVTLGAVAVQNGQTCHATYLDADDLLVGRIPLLGIPVSRDRHVWRPLTRKKIVWNTRGQSAFDNLDRAVAALFREGERLPMQATVDRAVARTNNLNGNAVASADQGTSVYLGEPMGIDTSLRHEEQSIDASVELPLGCTITLPRRDVDGDEDCPHALRFGMLAKVAHATRFLGGGGLSDVEAERAIAREPLAAVPPGLGRRHLRSEPAGPVAILLPKSECDAEAAAYRDLRRGRRPTRYALQTTGTVTLRSRVAGGRLATEGAARIVRIVMPPILPLDFAEDHGVFDERPQRVFPCAPTRIETVADVPLWRNAYDERGRLRRPRDGMAALHHDAAWGGYPQSVQIFDEEADRRALADVRFDDGAQWLAEARRWARDARDRDARDRKPLPAPPSGDGVFAARTAKRNDQGRVVPFYPDPMALRVVVRLREGRDLFVEDARRVVVDLVDPAIYPSVRPIALQIEHGRDDGAAAVEIAGTVTVEDITCTAVVVRLAPGMRGHVDIWALPEPRMLAAWSEIVDTAATLVAIGAIARPAGLPAPNGGQRMAGCGIAGAPSASPAEVMALAGHLHDILAIRPLPELSQVRSIAVLHAVTRPLAAPLPVAAISPAAPILLRRIRGGSDAGGNRPYGDDFLPAGAEPRVPNSWLGGRDPSFNVEPGGTEFDVGGFLAIHPASTGAVEVYVRAVAPLGGPMDDAETKRRAPEDVATGRFATTAVQDDVRSWTSRTYGFSVSTNDYVTLPTGEALLARFTGIDGSLGFDRSQPVLSLHALFGPRPAPGGPDIVAQIQPLFADTRTRRVEFRFRAISGHAAAFASRPYIDGNRTYHPAQSLSADETVAESDWTAPVILPASARPAQPVPAGGAHPVIDEVAVNDSATAEVRRRLGTCRLWLKRPWFSSGEDERLGIILWPRLTRPRGGSLPGIPRRGLVLRPSRADSEEPLRDDDFMRIDAFEDRDLDGVGGFVTRWGSDPAEAFPDRGWRDPVVPNALFADFEFADGGATSRRGDAEFVANVAMPIPDGRRDDKSGDAAAPTPPRMLAVDLMTYVPRFDVGREQWYVDVTLDAAMMVAPFVRLGVVRYQPHAPRDLQVSFPAQPYEVNAPTVRRTTVAVSASLLRRDIEMVHVIVRGPASDDPRALEEFDDAGVITRMMVRLQARERSTGTLRHDLEIAVAPRDDVAAYVVAMAGPTKIWSTRFEVPRTLRREPDVDLTVHVEELEIRPSVLADVAGAGAATSFGRPHLPAEARTRYLCAVPVPRPDG